MNGNFKKIVLFGASGTIGKILLKYLSNQNTLIPIYRSQCNLLNLNEIIKIVTDIQPNLIINCAAVGGKTSLGEFNKEELIENLTIYQNIENATVLTVDKYLINFGSGAEFDVTTDISNCSEERLFFTIPKDSYGLSKNIISKQAYFNNNVMTLRLFGCFDSVEPNFRLLKNLSSNASEVFVIKQNRLFSWISGIDLSKIVQHFINNKTNDDLNCAYYEKYSTYDICKLWCKLHNKSYELITTAQGLNYNCDVSKLLSYNIQVNGIYSSIKDY